MTDHDLPITDREDALGLVTAMRPIWHYFTPVEHQRWIEFMASCFSDVLSDTELAQIVREWETTNHE